MKEKPLADDTGHARACLDRWIKRINRDMDSQEYRDEWYAEQCLSCRYFVPLSGAFIENWGACTNPDSVFDGSVRFEHDGCSKHHISETWWRQDCQFGKQPQEG